jgi:hypothetical protein
MSTDIALGVHLGVIKPGKYEWWVHINVVGPPCNHTKTDSGDVSESLANNHF